MTIEISDQHAETIKGVMECELGCGPDVYDSQQISALKEVFEQIDKHQRTNSVISWTKSIIEDLQRYEVFAVGRSFSDATLTAIDNLAGCIVDDIKRQTLSPHK